MKLLVFSYYFPPASAVGGKRFANLTRHWLEQDHSVEIISAQISEYSSLDNSLPVPGRVNRVKTFPHSRPDTYRGMFRALYKVWARTSVFFDRFEGWINYASNAGIRAAKESRPDAIIATGPPFSSFIVAGRVAGRLGIPLILDYRDPWTTLKTSRFPPPMGALPGRIFERKLISTASAVISCTEQLKDQIVSRYPFAASLSHVVTNGYSEILHNFQPKRNEFVILYAGSFYGDRSLSPLISAVNSAIRKNPELKLKIRVLGGPVSEEDLRNFSNAGLTDTIENLGKVSYETALKKMATADILYLPSGEDVKYALPYKLFDYLAAGRPVFAVCPSDSALTEFVNSTNCGYCVDARNKDGIERLLEQAVSGDTGFFPADIGNFRWSVLSRRYISIISKAVDGGKKT